MKHTNNGNISDSYLFAIECDQDKVDKVPHIAQEIFTGTNSLIILDDCASSQDVKNITSELVKLAFSARHFALSKIVIIQQLNSISKPCRDNAAKVVTYNLDEDDMNVIFCRYLGHSSKSERNSMIEKLKNTKHSAHWKSTYTIHTTIKLLIHKNKICAIIYGMAKHKVPKPETIEEVNEDISTAENSFNNEIKNIFGDDNSNEKPKNIEPKEDNSNLEKKR